MAPKELGQPMRANRHQEYRLSRVKHFNHQRYIDLLSRSRSCEGIQFHAVVLGRLEPGVQSG